MHTVMTSKNDSTKQLDEVADTLRNAIANGERKPGERLVESQLCELFGVKRSVIREGLRKLAHEGFLKITPNVGASVTEFSRQDVEQVYDLLAVLEGLAVRLATPFITEEQILQIEELLKGMEGADDQRLFFSYNDTFHATICALSGNSRLLSMTDNLRLSRRAFGYQSLFVPGQTGSSKDDHRRILQAMKDNDPVQAEQLMRDHLFNAKIRLVKWLYRSL
jgi:DNA-binding GntR family transcriptional regulator